MSRMLDTTDDSGLAAAALRGDREAFARLVERHYDRVYRVAHRILGSAADAEDVAQEVAIALAEKLPHFRQESRFSTWVVAIAINRCRDMLRRRKSSAALAERYVVLRAAEEADAADTEARVAWLNEALQGLEPDLRETVTLVLGEALSHAEAGKILGCAESTVSWRMHKARKALQAFGARLDVSDG